LGFGAVLANHHEDGNVGRDDASDDAFTLAGVGVIGEGGG